ncbi:retrovirus-related Pol polyprotein from transposon opus [Trichonephila clavipes]|nr:retrovirus-related Pol polyprotein from transposon opus [Trichonephila clavipes]
MEDVIQRTASKRYKFKKKSAFNCISIRETDIHKTVFVTPDGHYEFLQMPFGVTNVPSTMTREIKLAYDHLAPHNVNAYIDDISTSHDGFNYHLKKSLFGRIVYQDDVRPDSERIAAIERYLTLKSIQEKSVVSLDLPVSFGRTDASYFELGAVLSQKQNGKRRVIEYASRTLKKDETRYHSNELECTAVHWALTEKFRLYLLGHKFQLITDNYTTTYVVAKSAINRKLAQYLVDLAQFDFTTDH